MMRYLIVDSDCWSWCRRSPSRSLKSPLVGRLKREWRVWPSTLKAATPVGAATRSRASRSSRRQLMRYDFPVPAVPDTIMCSGGGSAASACSHTAVYTCSCFPWRLRGSAEVAKTCSSAACRCREVKDAASSVFGYE